MTYVFDQAAETERTRLAGLEALWDPGTQEVLARVGVRPGLRCLEVGAGGGSIAQWLATQVGPQGHVVATDLDPRFVQPGPSLEVLQHDVLVDDDPGGPFDLIHARAVVEHLGDRKTALRRMSSWLAPGGSLLVEDFDWSTGTYPYWAGPQRTVDIGPLFLAVQTAVLLLMRGAGFAPEFGRELPALLPAAGLSEVEAALRCEQLRGGSAKAGFYTHSLLRFREALVGAGALTDDQVDEALELLADPRFTVLTSAMVAAWGRRR